MQMGQAYDDTISSNVSKALQIACDTLIDSAFEDFESIKEPKDIMDTMIGFYLPERYSYKYTPLFYKQFIVCLITVAWKMAQATPMLLASVAEELAAYAIVRQAQGILQDEMEEATEEDTLDPFIDLFFEDLDIEFLFDDASDGIDESVIGQYMGMASLAFDDWFKPFSNEAGRTVHPYIV